MLIKRFNNLFDSRKKKKGFTITLAAVILLGTLGVCVSCTQDAGSENNDMIIYENKDLGFSIGFPKEWEDRYIIEETDNGIAVISKKNHEFGGLLFGIERLVGELITEEDVEQSPAKEEIILKGNGYTYIARYASDIQYSPDDEVLSKEYQEMFDQIPDILKSIDILGDQKPKALNEGFKVVGSSFFTVEIPNDWEIKAFEDWALLWELYAGKEKVGEIEMIPYHSRESDDDKMTTVYIINEEIFRKARISLNIDDSNGEIIDKIKDSFVIIGGPSTVVDLQTDAQRYLDNGGRKIFGQIKDFEFEKGNDLPVAIIINVMEFIPDGPDDNNPNGFSIKDLNKSEKYSADSGVSIVPLIAPNYNSYGIYGIYLLEEAFIENYEHLKDFYYDFIVGSDEQLKFVLGHYIP